MAADESAPPAAQADAEADGTFSFADAGAEIDVADLAAGLASLSGGGSATGDVAEPIAGELPVAEPAIVEAAAVDMVQYWDAWQPFLDDNGRLWYWCSITEEIVWPDTPGDWRVGEDDATGRRWWWNSVGNWFWDPVRR